jgi:hypothetical protein
MREVWVTTCLAGTAGYSGDITSELRASLSLTRYQSTKAKLDYQTYVGMSR